MAQTGFTPILTYGSTTASNTPSAGNLTTSASGVELAVNAADGKLFYKDSGGVVQVLATKGTGAIGGSNTQVQYNSSGSLAGSANLTFDGTTLTANALTTTSTVTINGGTANGVAYLNASKVLTTGSALVFDGTNLGVGTSSPGAKLDIGGTNNTIFFKNSGATTGYALATVSNTGGVFQYGVSNSTGTFWGSGNAGNYSVNIGTTSAVNFGFGTSDTLRMTLDASGNLGLGVTPISSFAGYKNFQIASQGLISSDATSNGELEINNNAYRAPSTATLTYINSAAATKYAQYRGEHRWFYAASGTAGNAITFTQAMTLNASGGLSVGTTTDPGAGNIQLPAGGQLRFSSTAFITPEDNVTGARISAPGVIGFWTGSTPAERARITSGGDLLVGTTTTIGRVTARGGSGNLLCASLDSGTTGTAIYANVFDTAQFLSRFEYRGSQVGAITTNGTGTTYGTSSDYRLKEDIAPMTGALAKVAALKPVTYKWKSDGSDGEGFIAHELAEVVPQCVTGEKDAVDAEGKPQYQGIDTSFLVATLTAAIQEQQALITSLTARIAALEAK